MEGMLYDDIDITKVKQGEFFPSQLDKVEEEGKLLVAYLEYTMIGGQFYPVWRETELEIEMYYEGNTKKVCCGFVNINGERKFVTVYKYPEN